MSQTELSGKVAIVTGAGRGIGRATALSLAQAGAKVMLAARTESEIHAVRDEIAASHGNAFAVPMDVSDEAAVKSLIGQTIERYGRLDIVVNNAGIGCFGPLEHTSTQDLDRVLAVNVRGPFMLCREAIPYLRQHDLSFIINIASVVAVKGYAEQSAYAASKHALLGMSKVLAKEVQPDGIRVHAINPGGVATDLATQVRPDLDPTIMMQSEDIARIVMFLVTNPTNAVIDEIDVRRATSTAFA